MEHLNKSEGHDARQPLQPQLMARLQAQIQRSLGPQPTSSEERSTTNTEAITRRNNAPPTCPICRGAGFLRTNVALGHPQFGKLLVCSCQEQERKKKRRQQLWELSNVGALATQRFETFNLHVSGVQEAFQRAVAFSKNPVGWLLLVGPHGYGKTHLAAAVANACLDAGAGVLFTTVPDLLDHLRATFAPTSHEVYNDLFACVREAEILVLDDLGTQHSSAWANEKLFQLVNHRYNSGSPTVLTTSSKSLRSTDERICSRLSDSGLVTTLNLACANDYRTHHLQRRDMSKKR